MIAKKLKLKASQKNQPDSIPKGYFCRVDLEEEDNLTTVQASTLLRESVKEGTIECVGKFRVRKVSGDWGMVPFYKVVK